MSEARVREIVLDTETTGLDPAGGHRIVEIGALEMVSHVATGRTFHVHVDPEREVGDSVDVHGLTDEFLAGKPVFADVVDGFMEFAGDSPLVIHNAPFDLGFLNAELERLGLDPFPMDRTVDTLVMARKRFPGARASLDALCARFGIDNSHRQLHGAMVDADLLAEVYIELLGGRQPDLSFDEAGSEAPPAEAGGQAGAPAAARPPREHAPSPEELEAHRAFIATLSDPIWSRIGD